MTTTMTGTTIDRTRRRRLGRLTMAGSAVAVAVLLGIGGPADAAICSGAISKHPRITHICALMLQTSPSALAYVPTVYCIKARQANCQEMRRIMVDGGIVQGPGPDGYGTIASRLGAVFGMDDNGYGATYVLNP